MKRTSMYLALLVCTLCWIGGAEAQGCQTCWQHINPYNQEFHRHAFCQSIAFGQPSLEYFAVAENDCDCGLGFESETGRPYCQNLNTPCVNGTCGSTEDPDDTGILNDDGGTSPIVIDLGDRGFELTGLDDPVEFDIDADGSVETITWTSAAGDDAFLVLDRNGNGAIDDGSELFGTAAEQPPSEEPNGYLALGVFDAAAQGGDGDGWITPADAAWSSLQLWSDLDHDGTAQPLELSRLDDFGIAGIELAYVDSQRRDRHGNLLRWASRVRFEDGLRLAASDVIFRLAP